jgi:flavorubredoxin
MTSSVKSESTIAEIAEGIYRVHTPVPPGIIPLPGGFSFNQYLIVDDAPLLFHTGPRRMFPSVREAIQKVIPLNKLRYIGLSHFEADECGALNEFLAVAPDAEPVCSRVAAMASVNDVGDRPAKAMADGETLSLGKHTVRWLDCPHLPHGWECGYLMEEFTGTLLCGDLFTQPGAGDQPIIESDIFAPSESVRKRMDYFSHSTRTTAMLTRLADLKPRVLACMHGSAYRGDGAALLTELATTLGKEE